MSSVTNDLGEEILPAYKGEYFISLFDPILSTAMQIGPPVELAVAVAVCCVCCCLLLSAILTAASWTAPVLSFGLTDQAVLHRALACDCGQLSAHAMHSIAHVDCCDFGQAKD